MKKGSPSAGSVDLLRCAERFRKVQRGLEKKGEERFRKDMKWIKYIIVCMVAVMPLTGCRKVVGPTQVRVVDPVRHYLPILQGDILRMYWTICNDGPEPLVISEILKI